MVNKGNTKVLDLLNKGTESVNKAYSVQEMQQKVGQ
jgi:hypothetical protein